MACLIQLSSSRIEYIEENFEYNTFIRENQEKDNANIKYALRRRGRIIKVLSYNDILLKRQIPENVIVDSEHNISNIIQYFKRYQCYYEGECAAILDHAGNIQYVMEYHSNRTLFEWDKSRVFYNFYDYETLSPDLSILENADVYIINSFNEYTFHILGLLIKYYPKKKKIISNGELGRAFEMNHQIRSRRKMNDIKSRRVIEHQQEQGKRVMFISDNGGISGNAEMNQVGYRTIDVIHSLYGKAMTERLNPKIPQPFYIYDVPTSYHGIGDILKFVLMEQLSVELKGQILILYLCRKPNQYLEREGVDMWEYYFEQPTRYSVDQALASGNYIYGSDSNLSMFQRKNKIWNRFWHAFEADKQTFLKQYAFVERMRWRSDIVDYCKTMLPVQIQQKRRVLGVIARGTDYNNGNVWSQRNVDIDTLIRKTQYLMQKYHYEFIYLATEDLHYYEVFKAAFGGRMLATDQERIDFIPGRDRSIGFLSDVPKKVSGFQYGLNYLAVLYCLGNCTALLSSMDCGADWIALAISDNRYENHWLAMQINEDAH